MFQLLTLVIDDTIAHMGFSPSTSATTNPLPKSQNTCLK